METTLIKMNVQTVKDLLKQVEKVSGLDEDDKRSLEYVREVVISGSRDKDVMSAYLVAKSVLAKSEYKPVEYHKVLPYTDPGFVNERDSIVVSWEYVGGDSGDDVFGNCSIGRVLKVGPENITVDVYFSSEDSHMLSYLQIPRKDIRAIYKLEDVFKFTES